MSREAERLVREGIARQIDAWNRGDIDTWLSQFHPDAVVVMVGGFEGLMGREFHGHEEIRRFCEDWGAMFERVDVDLERVIPRDDGRVLMILTQRTRGRAGGVETSLRWGMLLSLRDGLVIRMENYYDVAEALQAVGVEE
jgi:ketosteroid isomerase-like protein